MSQHTYTFVSYYRHQHQYFSHIIKHFPVNTRVRHLNIYSLAPRSVLQFPLTAEISPETLNEIIYCYRKRKASVNPNIDTAQWRARLMHRAKQWYQLFLHRLRKDETLVVWNGHAIPTGAAVAAARAVGCRVIFCEYGVFPETVAIDPKGINYASSITEIAPEFFRRWPVDETRLQELFSAHWQQRPLRKSTADATAHCDDGTPLPPRYIVFAMQVHDDSQLFLFSKRFASMFDAAPYVWQQVQAYNARTGDDIRLVVKEHPTDFGRIDYRTLRASMPGALFLRATPIDEIFRNALAVVTINSSVGIKALLCRRPVITLGDAFYNIPGVVRHLGQDGVFADALADVLSSELDQELIAHFLYFLREEFLVALSRNEMNPNRLQRAAQRIMDIAEGRVPWAQAVQGQLA